MRECPVHGGAANGRDTPLRKIAFPYRPSEFPVNLHTRCSRSPAHIVPNACDTAPRNQAAGDHQQFAWALPGASKATVECLCSGTLYYYRRIIIWSLPYRTWTTASGQHATATSVARPVHLFRGTSDTIVSSLKVTCLPKT